MCHCDFLPHYFIWNTEDTQQLYPNRLVELVCIQVCASHRQMQKKKKKKNLKKSKHRKSFFQVFL